MSSSSHQGFNPMDELTCQMIDYLLDETQDEFIYTKSEDIANALDATTKQIAVRIPAIQQRCDKLEIEKWASTRATTWLVKSDSE